MNLQAELVEVRERDLAEIVDEITLNKELLGFGRFLFPGGLFQREKPVPDEPLKRHRTIVHDLAWGTSLPDLFCDFALQ
jgi:hypothetical protein